MRCYIRWAPSEDSSLEVCFADRTECWFPPHLNVVRWRSTNNQENFESHDEQSITRSTEQYLPFSNMEFRITDVIQLFRLTSVLLKRGIDQPTGFDVSPDGKQIIFDRVQDNSNVVLITPPGA
jgi:hypothetical protein